MGDVQRRDGWNRSSDCPGGGVGEGKHRPEAAQRRRKEPAGHLQPQESADGQAVLHPLRGSILPPGFGGQGGDEKQQMGVLWQDQKRRGFLPVLPNIRKRAETAAVPGVQRDGGGCRGADRRVY